MKWHVDAIEAASEVAGYNAIAILNAAAEAQFGPTLLLPAENMALTVARSMTGRGEAPGVNVAAVLVMALDRLEEIGGTG